MIDFLHQLDLRLFLILNNLHAPWADIAMSWISSRWIWIPFYLFLIVILSKKFGWRIVVILLMVGLLILMSDQSSVLIKESVQRLRPCHVNELKNLVHTVGGKCGGKYGFVSSHASNTFALAFFLIPFLQRIWGYFPVVMIIWALIISYSRIYLGVHYPGDVLGGMLLGIFCGYICRWIYARLPEKLKVKD